MIGDGGGLRIPLVRLASLCGEMWHLGDCLANHLEQIEVGNCPFASHIGLSVFSLVKMIIA